MGSSTKFMEVRWGPRRVDMGKGWLAEVVGGSFDGLICAVAGSNWAEVIVGIPFFLTLEDTVQPEADPLPQRHSQSTGSGVGSFLRFYDSWYTH